VIFAELEELGRLAAGTSTRQAPAIGASTAPGAFWLPSRLAQLEREHSLQCDCRIGDSRLVRSWVSERRVLFGLVGELPEAELKGFELQEVGRDSLQLMAARGHVLSAGNSLGPPDFKRQTLFLRPEGSSTRTRAQLMLSPILDYFQRVVELNSGEAIKEAVLAGLGLAVLSTWSVQRELESELIVPLEPDRWTQFRPIYLIRRAARPLRGQAAFLWDFLTRVSGGIH